MSLILDDLKYKNLKFTNQRRSHSLLSIKRKAILCLCHYPFDKVPHQRPLLLKLEQIGIKGNVLGWIECFLTKRFQKVVLKPGYFTRQSARFIRSTCTTRFFYKNNEAQIYPKIKNKLRTIMRLGFRCKCNYKLLLKNTTHHVITCSVSLPVFLQLETLSEQRRKSKLRRTCLMTCLY